MLKKKRRSETVFLWNMKRDRASGRGDHESGGRDWQYHEITRDVGRSVPRVYGPPFLFYSFYYKSLF